MIVGLAALLLLPAAISFYSRFAAPVLGRHPVAAGGVVSPKQSIGATSPAPATPVEHWQESPPRSGVDGSGFYKNAFVLIAQLSPEEKALFLKPTEEVDADQAEALFQKIQPIMELLRSGAKADYCDWALGPINLSTNLPHVSKSMELGKLALWNAAYRFANEPQGALDDLAVRARLGHDLSDTLEGILVSNTFEGSAKKLLRQNLSTMTPESLGGMADFLANSVLDHDISRAMEGERAVMGTMSSMFSGISSKEGLATFLGMTSDVPRSESENARTESILQTVSDPARLRAEISYTQDLEKELEAALTLPEAEFQSRWKAILGGLNADHPLAREILPTFAGVQRNLQVSRVERQMLTTGLAILQNGLSQLSAVRDPATGRTFDYVPTPTGFELRSTYQMLKGKPITMTFSQPPR